MHGSYSMHYEHWTPVAELFLPCVKELHSCRYTYPKVQLFREIREDLIWADGGAVKKVFDEAILQLLGPETEADKEARSKKPAKKASHHFPAAPSTNVVAGNCTVAYVQCAKHSD